MALFLDLCTVKPYLYFSVVKSYWFIQGGAKGSLEKFEGYQSVFHSSL